MHINISIYKPFNSDKTNRPLLTLNGVMPGSNIQSSQFCNDHALYFLLIIQCRQISLFQDEYNLSLRKKVVKELKYIYPYLLIRNWFVRKRQACFVLNCSRNNCKFRFQNFLACACPLIFVLVYQISLTYCCI